MMNKHPEIKDLIEQCRKGNPEALGCIVDLYAARCFGYFYRLTSNRSTSEELLSDLYVRLVQKIDTFKGGSFEKWLFTVASNIFRDYLRKQYRQKRLIEEKAKLVETQNRPEKEMDLDLSERLQKGLKTLDMDTAELILMRFYGDLSFTEIAEIKAQPIGTVLSRVHRGLKKIKDWMEESHERK